MPRDLKLIPYKELTSGKCINGKPHKVWFGYTGDSWPAFCINEKCRKHSTDVPASDRDFN